MSAIKDKIIQEVVQAFPTIFNSEITESQITLNDTPKEFVGDVTLVVFPLLKWTKKKPEESAELIGQHLQKMLPEIASYNIIKGFLNLEFSDAFWTQAVDHIQPKSDKIHTETILVEYSSPNTNKPIHLGHVRNNVLGYALAGIYKANNYPVVKCNLINDRGIHICKSMLAWQKWGNGETPESTGMKGDHLVGKYYVEFDKANKAEVESMRTMFLSNAPGKEKQFSKKAFDKLTELYAKLNSETNEDKKKEIADAIDEVFKVSTPLYTEAQNMLLQWENGDAGIVQLWTMMNGWVYAGFEITYKNLGVDFDKFYYESNTYLLGKDIIEEGLEKGVFYKKEDGSVWIDLTADGLDHKLVLRADGTSVYITQDMGTADLKYQDFHMNTSIYVVGNEQDYHFKVLKLIMQKMGRPYADGIHHFSYGMVDLPSGKMKSREGTVVDADDLMQDMLELAEQKTREHGKLDDFSEEEKQQLYRTIGLGALKFFLLRVDPKKRILFNPEESIDMYGYTGPFVQYSYARTKSILRKAENGNFTSATLPADYKLHASEKEIIAKLYNYSAILEESCDGMNPAVLVDYVYEIAKTFNKFYNDCPILKAETEDAKLLRLQIADKTAEIIRHGFNTVGIDVPERM
ncbi:MAG TPA: arginine--tRNA ligase [Chitinophagales bacterium]|nr:arginine--tRNA ligase [Chitinophagales bacterium]